MQPSLSASGQMVSDLRLLLVRKHLQFLRARELSLTVSFPGPSAFGTASGTCPLFHDWVSNALCSMYTPQEQLSG